MRILIVSSYLPFPLHDGAAVRLYNLIKELAKHHKITLVCEIRAHQTKKDIEEVKKFCEDVFVVEHRKPWTPEHVLKSGFSMQPLLLVMHTFPEMKKKIVTLLSEKRFDLIHVETFYVMQNLPKTYLPIVLAEHNIEYQVYRRYIDTMPVFLRPFLLPEIEKLAYAEKHYWKKATKLVAVSSSDQAIMKRDDAVVVPNGVDIKSFPFVSSTLKQRRKERRILFLGNFKWIQNTNAAKWILEEIWPKIAAGKDAKGVEDPIKLWIVGKHIPEAIKKYNGGSIFIDENAPEETAKIYQRAYMLLAPIKVGGGTSYKILEAMASGVPVVTTELGVKGLGARPGKEALVSQTAEGLANHVIALLEDQDMYTSLQKEARMLIENRYTWSGITQTLEKVYNEAREI